MLNNKIYSKYFPVKSHVTQFDEEEKKTLCTWASTFKTEVRVREIEKSKSGRVYIYSYDMSKYDEKTMRDMIRQNCFDDENLAMLNIILYRHKYNAFLSLWFFPMLTKSKIVEFFGDMTNE